MSKISERNINKIKENIIRILYDEYPQAVFSTHISKLEARDHEFILKLLKELENSGIVKSITKSRLGKQYIERKRWMLSNEVYEKYKELIQ